MLLTLSRVLENAVHLLLHGLLTHVGLLMEVTLLEFHVLRHLLMGRSLAHSGLLQLHLSLLRHALQLLLMLELHGTLLLMLELHFMSHLCMSLTISLLVAKGLRTCIPLFDGLRIEARLHINAR